LEGIFSPLLKGLFRILAQPPPHKSRSAACTRCAKRRNPPIRTGVGNWAAITSAIGRCAEP